jgi:mannitol/fructose-specific phosphotransferase system IIA component (Ntr-type)
MVKIHTLLDEGLVLPRLESRDRAGVLREMSARLEAHLPGLEGTLFERLMKREELGTTAIGKGVAVPHCRARGIKVPALLLGLSPEGVAFEAVDDVPSCVFFLLVSPEDNPGSGLRVLAAIAGLVRRSRSLTAKLLKARTAAAVIEALRAEEERVRA